MKKIFGTMLATALVFALSLFTLAASPGVNIFTGNTSALSFDELTEVPSFIENATLSSSPISGESGKVLLHSHSGTGTYATMPFVFSPALDCERPYLFKYKMYEKANNGLGSNRSLWVMKNSTSGWQKAWSGAGPIANDATWRSYSCYLDNLGSLVNTNTNTVDKTAVSKIILEWVYDSAAEVGKNHWVYVDDVSLIPAYLITYTDKDGKTIKTEYIHPDYKSFAPTLSDEDTENSITGWALTKGGDAVSSVSLSDKDITLYAVYEEPEIDFEMPAQTVTPGINLLTGTTEVYTFDNDKALPSFISGAELVDSPYTDESGKAIRHISDGAQYGFMNLLLNPAVDCERGYQVSFKMYYKSDAELSTSKDSFWVLKNGVSKWQIADTGTNVLFNSENWYEYSKLIDNFGSLVNSSTNEVDKSKISKIVLEWTYEGVGGTNQFVYLDDISIVPAYFVAFIGEDGKPLKSGYMNLTGSSYSPTVLPDEKDLGIIGWSLENDNTVDEKIPLENKDFILYAVYDNTLYLNLDTDKNMLTSVGDSTTVECNPECRKGTDGITFSFSCQDDSVTVVDNGNGTATVTSKKEGLAKIICTASSGETEEIYILSDYGEGKEVMKIVKSVSKIDTDAQSETVTAVLFAPLEKNTHIRWKSSSDCVTISSNGNGTATITPVSNGVALITAYIEGYEEISDSFTLTVSGQAQKEKVYELNVLVWGASLVKHPPAENLFWYGNWGMAASGEQNDMVHRLVHYLEEQYYPSKVNLHLLAESGFDTSINNDTSTTTDYRTNQYYLNLENAIKEFNPNIIVTVRTGNLSDDVNVDIAYNAYSQIYDMIYTHVPNAIVLGNHCLLRHSEMKEELYKRLDERYPNKIFVPVDLDVHEDRENLAQEWIELGQQAVANHWNDKGHDKVAQINMVPLNEYIPEVLTPSFVYFPESITISGNDTITEKGGAVQLYATVSPDDAINSVTWSVDNENIATINKNGLLTAKNNGTVYVTAKSIFDESVSATYKVTVTNQPEAFTLSYSQNTSDEVIGMPKNDEYASGSYVLSSLIPKRETYNFVGWGLTHDAKNVVSEIEITSHTTVYAIWEKISGFEFEGTYTEDDGFCYGFDIAGGFHVEVRESCLRTICTAGDKVTFKSPLIEIENRNIVSFRIESGYFDESSTVELTVKTDKGHKVFVFPLVKTSPVTYSADITGLSGKITGFEIFVNSAPEDKSMFDIALDYVRFETSKQICESDDDFILMDENVIISNMDINGFTEIESPESCAMVTLSTGNTLKLCDMEYFYADIIGNGKFFTVNHIDYINSFKYKDSSTVVYTKNGTVLTKENALSEKLTTFGESSMRINDPKGVRIKASVVKDFSVSEEIAEYGYVATRLDYITSGKISDVILDEKYISSKYVLFGKAFSKSQNIHKVFESDDDYEFFTGVLINIPMTEDALRTTLVFRPYVKLTDGSVLYGSKIETSAFETAIAVYHDKDTDDTTKAEVKEILTICKYDAKELLLPLDSLWD